jgi:hypothetical protein
MTLHPLSQAGMFIYSSCEKWALSPLLYSFPPTATFTSFPASDSWVCAAAPAFSSRLVYLQFQEGFPSPLVWHSGLPTLFATCVFFCYCLLFSFSFFPGWGSVWPEGMLIWPRVVCRGTTYRLAHLVACVFPSHLGAGVWQRHESPAVFCL